MHRRRSRHLRRLGTIAAITAVALGVIGGLGGPAFAHEDDTTIVTTSLPPGGIQLQPGYVFYGATATCPGKPPVQWSASQTAAFAQIFFTNLFTNSSPLQNPPAGVPICKVAMRGIIDSDAITTYTANYAVQGDKAWAQNPGYAWFLGVPRMKGAIEGTEGPIINTTVPASTTTEAAKPSTSADSNSASNGGLIAVGVALLAAAVGAVVYGLRRRSTGTEAPPASAAPVSGADQPDAGDGSGVDLDAPLDSDDA